MKNLVFNYAEDKFVEYDLNEEELCEDFCVNLCKKLKIAPLVHLLFGLRTSGTDYFLLADEKLEPNVKYEFRVRYKIPKLSNFKHLDKQLFNYYYFQLRHDLLHSHIGELEYPKYKNKILGYVVSDMYRKMLEDKRLTVGDLRKDYKTYMPKKICEKHSILSIDYAKSRVFNLLSKIENKNHAVEYVKSVYIDDIDNLAPGYLYEEYSVSIEYPEEDHLKRGTCPAKIKFVPFVADTSSMTDKEDLDDGDKSCDKLPGLKVFYSSKWSHLAKIQEIFTILRDKNIIEISIKDEPTNYRILFQDERALKSFVGYLSGYYRLMCKWTQNLCRDSTSPTLTRLLEMKCHGPIGGKFSYNKIMEKKSSVGAHIVRQCEYAYDTYYVDMLTAPDDLVSYKVISEDAKWYLYKGEARSEHPDLIQLIKSIEPSILNIYRISPSEYDKPPKLLLCAPSQQNTSKKLFNDFHELKQIRPQIINAATELFINRSSINDPNDVNFELRKAEYQMPNNTKLEVTLKMLKSDKKNKYLDDFLQLADFWARLDSIDILKLYGVTLHRPVAMVTESAKLGPLDEFLRKIKPSIFCLFDAASTLARALYYLHEQGIAHGRLRCSNLYVCKADLDRNHFVCKLSDGGISNDYNDRDLPWVPVEYQELTQIDKNRLKFDPKADLWACATVFWEIFSFGQRIRLQNPRAFFKSGKRLREPQDMPLEICRIMYQGWLDDPDKRFSIQESISSFIGAKQRLSDPYNEVGPPSTYYPSSSRQSLHSRKTEDTYVGGGSRDSEIDSNSSNYSSQSDYSEDRSTRPLINGYHGSMNSDDTLITEGIYHSQIDDDVDDNMYIETDFGKIIFQGQIGSGHYGTVHRGVIDDDDKMTPVALKKMKSSGDNMAVKDFKREIRIMRDLSHPNIVKVINYIDEPKRPLIIIMEFMDRGDLHTFVKTGGASLSVATMLKYSKNIASGMAYLASKNIVHRDLAARNVLVNGDDSVKISDFGLAQLTNENYYFSMNKRDLPIKWFAPESLGQQKFSSQSDVWSYGITVFEIFSYGDEPYNGQEIQDGQELLEKLENGERIQPPRTEQCKRKIYEDLMLSCWAFNPHQRPTFAQLEDRVQSIINYLGVFEKST